MAVSYLSLDLYSCLSLVMALLMCDGHVGQSHGFDPHFRLVSLLVSSLVPGVFTVCFGHSWHIEVLNVLQLNALLGPLLLRVLFDFLAC